MIRLGIPKESFPGERRIAVAPDSVVKLKSLGFAIAVEKGAGVAAGFTDEAYEKAGAEAVDADAAWQADVVLRIRPPTPDEAQRMKEGGALICMLRPAENAPLLEVLGKKKASALALEKVPRISRAQKMDVLSSMANIAGHRAVLEASTALGSFLGAQTTAAGAAPPAKVLIIGAGVAGLAALAAGRALGADVRAFDTRPACREQVESLGGKFLTVELEESGEGQGGYAKEMSPAFIAAEMALFEQQATEVDIVVTTALIPGKKAPILWTSAALKKMRRGAVVVDLAAEQGGNCEGTVPGEAVEVFGVKILGFTDLPSRMAPVASKFFGANLVALLGEMGGGEKFDFDEKNDAIRPATVMKGGEKLPDVPPPQPSPQAVKPKPAEVPKALPKPPPKGPGLGSAIVALVALGGIFAVAPYLPGPFLSHLTVFVLACFVGWQVVWSVSHSLHTPLMSVTNAISGIIVVGGVLQSGSEDRDLAAWLGAVAVLVASINIAGGFLVTHRMLKMFRKDPS